MELLDGGFKQGSRQLQELIDDVKNDHGPAPKEQEIHVEDLLGEARAELQ